MAEQKFVVGIDVGTVKTAVLIGEVGPENSLSLISFAAQATGGMDKGKMLDAAAVEMSVAAAWREATQNLSAGTARVYASWSGADTSANPREDQLQHLLQTMNIQVDELVPIVLADAQAVLSAAEMAAGCLLVDIGGGTTEVAIYEQGCLFHHGVLPVGGNQITNDLAIGLQISKVAAEMLKIHYGIQPAEAISGEETFALLDAEGAPAGEISRQVYGMIVDARIMEIFALIKDQVVNSGYRGKLSGGAIITGGTAAMSGLAALAQREWDLAVRIGCPGPISGMNETMQSPAYAAGVGLILYGTGKTECERLPQDEVKPARGWVSKIRNFFWEYFE